MKQGILGVLLKFLILGFVFGMCRVRICPLRTVILKLGVGGILDYFRSIIQICCHKY